MLSKKQNKSIEINLQSLSKLLESFPGNKKKGNQGAAGTHQTDLKGLVDEEEENEEVKNHVEKLYFRYTPKDQKELHGSEERDKELQKRLIDSSKKEDESLISKISKSIHEKFALCKLNIWSSDAGLGIAGEQNDLNNSQKDQFREDRTFGAKETKIWNLRINLRAPLDHSFYFKIHKKRKIKDLIDPICSQILENLSFKNPRVVESMQLYQGERSLDLEKRLVEELDPSGFQIDVFFEMDPEIEILENTSAELIKRYENKQPFSRSYHLVPSSEELLQMTKKELKEVRNFSVENQYASVTFLEPVNLLKFEIDENIELDHQLVKIHPDRPQELGTGFNQSARIVFKEYFDPEVFRRLGRAEIEEQVRENFERVYGGNSHLQLVGFNARLNQLVLEASHF